MPSCQVVPNTHADLSHLSTASGTAVPTANGNCAEGMASPSHESNCSSSKQHNSKNSVAAAVVVAGIASAEVGCQPQHQQQHTSSSSSSIAAANNGFQHQPKLLRVQDHVYGILRCDWSFFFYRTHNIRPNSYYPTTFIQFDRRKLSFVHIRSRTPQIDGVPQNKGVGRKR